MVVQRVHEEAKAEEKKFMLSLKKFGTGNPLFLRD
jgi:hypothetical protein